MISKEYFISTLKKKAQHYHRLTAEVKRYIRNTVNEAQKEEERQAQIKKGEL